MFCNIILTTYNKSRPLSDFKSNYSQTCIEQLQIKQLPCIKCLFTKSQHLYFLITVIFTSIEQSPFKESKRPLCIFFHLYWMVTLNKSTIFEQVYWTIMAWSDIFLKIIIFLSWISLFCGTCIKQSPCHSL